MRRLKALLGIALATLIGGGSLLVFALLLGVQDGSTQTTPGPCWITGALRATASQVLTVSGTALALDSTKTAGSRLVVAQVQSQPIRYWDDGTTPTATSGIYVTANTSMLICGNSIALIKFILDTTGTTSATVAAIYYTY